MALVRTFIGIEVSEEIRSAGMDLIRGFSAATEGVRWVRAENLHATVKFLGEVEDRELHRVCQLTANSAGEVSQFTVRCESIGAFPNLTRPSTIWMGLNDSEGRLADLHMRVETSFEQLGFPSEHRPFRGHITLGRLRSKKSANEQLSGLSLIHI